MLEELVSNAIRHGGASEITISLTSSGEDVSVEVHDNGTPRKRGRSGLGSAILKSVVGTLEMTSDLDGNTTKFRIAQ